MYILYIVIYVFSNECINSFISLIFPGSSRFDEIGST